MSHSFHVYDMPFNSNAYRLLCLVRMFGVASRLRVALVRRGGRDGPPAQGTPNETDMEYECPVCQRSSPDAAAALNHECGSAAGMLQTEALACSPSSWAPCPHCGSRFASFEEIDAHDCLQSRQPGLASQLPALVVPFCARACEGAPALRLGPEWGEPLRECAECHVEAEVGAVDYDDGMWSTPPLDDTDRLRR